MKSPLLRKVRPAIHWVDMPVIFSYYFKRNKYKFLARQAVEVVCSLCMKNFICTLEIVALSLQVLVAQRWKVVPLDLKMKLEELSELDKLRYKKELQEWELKAKSNSSKVDAKSDSNFDNVLKRIEVMKREISQMQGANVLLETPQDAFTGDLDGAELLLLLNLFYSTQSQSDFVVMNS